jgi:hypothetical protein
MVQLNANIQNVLVYSIDGEKALAEGFGKPLPFAQHLLCDIHIKDNIQSKLTNLGIRDKAGKTIHLSHNGRQTRSRLVTSSWKRGHEGLICINFYSFLFYHGV